ncbi:ATP-binding protein [Corynebacterium falsenii]|uniref:ATP-binding protein n=1 Tax=Corynebacterium falsenii TaxID=108486 RepID=UPI003FD319FC
METSIAGYHGNMPYIPRTVDSQLEHLLSIAGGIEITGPRGCGKTETALQVSKSIVRLDLENAKATTAQHAPQLILQGETPQLLDEWQVVPNLWNAVRHEIDKRSQRGQFILTGSAMPEDDPHRHSGAGRIMGLRMRTMSLHETGHSTGAVSLSALLRGEDIDPTMGNAEFLDVVNRLVSGGFPGWFDLPPDDAQLRAMDWLEQIVNRDLPQVLGSSRNPQLIAEYLRALSQMIAQPAKFAAIARRLPSERLGPIPQAAPSEIHRLLERAFVVDDLPAWSPKLRTASTAATAPVRYLADPSLAAAALRASTERLLADLRTLGFFFEAQVAHDLRVYSPRDARGVFHYRDMKGRDEIDVVVEAGDGSWIGFEVKLSADVADDAAAKLLAVAAKMERPATALGIIVPDGPAYRRDDGVYVLPLTTLGP